MIASIIFWIFLAATFIQVLFWVGIYGKLAIYKEKKDSKDGNDFLPPTPLKGELSPELVSEIETRDSSPFRGVGGKKNPEIPVSIIICAHNEIENLKKNLPRILNQNYRSYEVLVICHNCTDSSETFLIHLSKTYKKLRIIKLDNEKKGKKSALACGIEKAQHEVLLLTDADCYPISENWLQNMQSVLSTEVDIGLGYAPLEKSLSFLNKFIQYETNFTAVQYLSFALAGIPYMGVGRNLIYKKSLFTKIGGFEKHADTTSGDDDLFINAAARRGNTKIILAPETFVYSPAKETWREWFQQKSRHLTTGRKYRPFHQFLLGLASVTHFVHYVAGIAVIFYFGIVPFLYLYIFRQIIMLLIFRAILTKLHDATHTNWLPVMDAAHIIYYIIYSPTIFFGHQKRNW